MIATETDTGALSIQIGDTFYPNVTREDWLWEKYWNAVDDGWASPPLPAERGQPAAP